MTATFNKTRLNTVLHTLDPTQYPSTNVQQHLTYSIFRESTEAGRDNSVLSAWVSEPLDPPVANFSTEPLEVLSLGLHAEPDAENWYQGYPDPVHVL